MPRPLLLIPARLASTRLPDKPLAEIGGVPMIVQVWRRAMEADIGPVAVACADAAIAEAVAQAGGRAVLTDPALASGSDRIAAALALLDPERRHDVIVNVQGDLPTLAPAAIRAAAALLDDKAVAIGTLGALIEPAGERAGERDDPNVVKAAVEWHAAAAMPPQPGARGRALYFSRHVIPSGEGECVHHIGLYAYRRGALEAFVAAPPSRLEGRERLEQLRALALGLRIDLALVADIPLGVDTQADLEEARRRLAVRV
jgi:3-deoxy-manno-octulosonate cytidylyltransferase (CMP-KDO synthetase)